MRTTEEIEKPFCGAWRGSGSVDSSGLFGFFDLSGSENEINQIDQRKALQGQVL